MAVPVYTWSGPVSGNSNDPTKFVGGKVVSNGDELVLPAFPSPSAPYYGSYTVTASLLTGLTSLSRLTTGLGATFKISTSSFAITSGITNAGTIQFGGSVTVNGTIANTGLITTVVNAATKMLIQNKVTLTGGGRFELINAAVTSTGTGLATLENVGNTLIGYGKLGVAGTNGLDVINRAGGVITASYLNIPANATINQLTVAGNRVENAGLMQATGFASLNINATTFVNTGQVVATVSATYNGSNGPNNSVALAINANTIVNSGRIESATKPTASMGGTIFNSGTISSTGGGQFQLSGIVTNTGTIAATGAGSVIYLSGAKILGGTLSTSNGGLITTGSSSLATQGIGWATLDGTGAGAPVKLTGTLSVNGGGPGLVLKGSIVNSGTILNPALAIDGSATLSGGGTVDLSGETITTIGSAATLTNAGNTIMGTGTLGSTGAAGLNVVNQAGGVINANGPNALIVTGNLFTNAGLMQATGSGRLDIRATQFVNSGQVVSAGGALLMNQSSVTNTIVNSGLIASASTASASVAGTITNTGTIASTGGGKLSLYGPISNGAAGVIRADHAGSQLTINATATLNNAGRIESLDGGSLTISGSAVANTGTLAALGGSLTVSSAVTGSGAAIVGAGSRLTFGAASSNNVTFQAGSAGVLELDKSGLYTGTLSGFSADDMLDLRDLKYGSAARVSYAGTAAGGTLTVTSGTVTGSYTLVGNYTTTGFTVANDGAAGTSVVLSSATVGTAANNSLVASGSAVLTGNGGTDTYQVARTGAGAVEIINGVPGAAAAGELLLGTGIATNQLWFDRVNDAGVVSATGDNLRAIVMGTSQRVTIDDWFNTSLTGAKLADIKLAGSGLKLDAGVANLVNAMATFETSYAASHGGAAFDPTAAANSTITDATVLAAVGTNWHA